MSRVSRIKVVAPERDKVPFRTRFFAEQVMDDYRQDRKRIIGMKETSRGLQPHAYGIGTILTFSENRTITVTADTYKKLGFMPTAQEEVRQVILPKVGVVAPMKKVGQAIVGFELAEAEAIFPTLIPRPEDEGFHLRGKDEDLDISTEIFFDDIMIAREVPIGGFKLRHYLNPSDLSGMSF